MTPQERQLIDELFDRLSRIEGAPRDPDAVGAIAQGLRAAPNAVYALVQTVLVQDEALKRANGRIQELEAGGAHEPAQSGSFLDSVRETVFGQGRGSVPNVRPPEMTNTNRPVWNSGQVMQQAQSPGSYNQGAYNQGGYNQGPANQGSYNQGSYGQPYGAPQGPLGGGGGSFLGTAAAAAAGAVGGSLLLGSIRSMMGGGSHQAFGDPSTIINEKVINESPRSDQSGSELARDAGVNDVGSNRNDDNSRAGFFDSASNDDDNDDDGDSDDLGGDGDSDYA
jgi:uncharacterized protein